MPEAVRGLLVLVVDDVQVIADSLCMIFNQNGFDARAVYSPETAVLLARALRPNAVVSDVFLGGMMTGIELAVLLTKELPECTILLCSGQTAAADLLHDAELKGHHFEMFIKPIHPQVLLDRLARCAKSVS